MDGPDGPLKGSFMEDTVEFFGYFEKALTRMEELYDMGVMDKMKEHAPVLYARMEQGQEVINKLYRKGDWKTYKVAVDLWEKIFTDWVRSEILCRKR